MKVFVNGKSICELEPIEATQLPEEQLHWYTQNCFSLTSPFQPIIDLYHSFIEHGTNILYNIWEGL